MSTHNFGALRRAVIEASLADRWAQAVEEWQVVCVEEDPHATGICVCGKTGLVYLYTILLRALRAGGTSACDRDADPAVVPTGRAEACGAARRQFGGHR